MYGHVDLTELKHEELCLRDPLAKLLLKASHKNGFLSALIAIAVYSILILGVGYLISISYIGIPFLRIYDAREFSLAIILYLIGIPIVWLFYISDLSTLLNLFRDLGINDVVKFKSGQYSDVNDFIKSNYQNISKTFIWIVPIILTLIILMIWTLQVLTPHDRFRYGFPQSWWNINPFYYWGIWVPIVFVSVYMLAWIFIRRIITVITINKLLEAFETVPKLFHPDQCNGLAPIGIFAVKISPLVLFAGGWLFVVIAYPIFFREQINLKYDVILYIIVYILFVPSLLLFPVWKTHLIMKKAKFRSLELLAEQMRVLLMTTEFEYSLPTNGHATFMAETKRFSEVKGVVEIITVVESLERKYRLLEKEYRLWPLNTSLLRQFILSAAGPLIPILISIILQKII